ncbi:hypothetical protein GCM10027074_41910 [Streptomyces deserti]
MAIGAWPDDGAAVLAAVQEVFPAGPAGTVLESRCPGDKPVDSWVIAELARFLARLTTVRKETLPPLPAEWPGNQKDSRAYLDLLVRRAQRWLNRSDWADTGGLFAVLGVPADALVRFASRLPSMARRPYGLLHTDLGRDKVLVLDGEEPAVACADWGGASYGDPLHGLVSHLVRMRYPEHQVDEVIHVWVRETRRIRPMAVSGVSRDYRHYVDFERIHAGYAEVVRAARSLGDSFDDALLAAAAGEVTRALEHAAEPLGMAQVPTEREIEGALFRWQAARVARRGGRLPATVFGWRRDPRVPERDDFPQELVRRALAEEGAAAADRVFRGTAHLNSVVSVPGYPDPVVVRRETTSAPRREKGFLHEHAVLQVIEKSGPQVRAPRILALGYDDHGRHFAIHTYEGPTAQAPDHPVHGLLPHEADQLVDQLAALARVDHSALPSGPPEADFYAWLSGRLVELVDELPDATRQAARRRGLPDGTVLRRILGRCKVTERAPVLLHGDLNPWNLVRDGRGAGLTIIDWEMAMIGDPLYDVVRHLHLTPARAGMRERMFERWSRTLPPRCVTGWERDWQVYRWIEQVRSAYVDLDRLVTGAALDTPNVRRAVDAYEMTLAAATASLGLRRRPVPSAPALSTAPSLAC